MATHPVSLESSSETAESSEIGNSPHVGCPMSGLLESLTRPWTLHILWQLSTHGPMRFGALRRSITGISARLLTVRLRALESEGFLRRSVIGGKTPEVTYSPTARLADMNAVMGTLHELSAKWHLEDNGTPLPAEFRDGSREN